MVTVAHAASRCDYSAVKSAFVIAIAVAAMLFFFHMADAQWWRVWPSPSPVRAVPRRQAAPTPKPTPKVFVALPNYDEETATRLQIFLDNSDFGPGKIDGKMGEFFRKGLISYKHALAMPKTGAVDSWLLDQVPVTYTTYTIREEDLKSIGNVPSTHAEQAKLKWL